jgi:hypothetical protein
MKKISFYVVITLLSGSINVHAQDFALGARGGISIPNLSAGGSNETPLNTGYSSRQGADGGIFAEFKFSQLFSLEPMIEYSAQGGKKDGMQALTTPSALAAMYPAGQAPQYLYANYKSEAKLNYLMIPVLAKFGWNFGKSPWRIYADVGPFAGFLLSAKQVTSGQSQLYLDAAGQEPLPTGEQSFNNTENIKSQLQSVNVGIEGNVGLNYRFGPNSVFIEGGGNYGFLNIQKGSENGKNNTGAATGVVGYSYWLHQHKQQDKKA